MCISKPPDPKPAPPPPDPNAANKAAADDARRAGAGRVNQQSNILTKLSDQAVASSSRKKRLGE
ncbi:hypothetical protein [Nitratireductor indicus]|uniref:hypothetical protein n=1 Tax=Nitratireductor indicus TaxID=721133 RepID=UPI00287450A3|nr:hypothetical protein [Nitratireductor indicus]MDS1138587.1 hypothetical protein [Nitratireductor indicus]